ncbi:WD40 repeat domain-containing serine/threonine protein kinase [Luteolibacter flavescens]|uniref:WD40 repeat domain-containing serine/threonine protein kinase n=1 Tax=Luteolibacter flavescens TaxID=1859460 RepID=A0ABT3FQD1_9BACT|nr:WD40 repeat domain-containing serine/threonine protein kinase [Luteolibacter flavescens]MCW1885394.1 WD40 repeat domain-containing serine/threonine protein kinase [Luteolibacter flavescens]
MTAPTPAPCPTCGEVMNGGPCPRCLFAVSFGPEVTSEESTPWTRIGNCDLHEEIGRGGMGVVYRAWQPGLDREVAVKVLRHARFAGPEERMRFHREAKAAARLKHPGIVAIHDIGEDEGVPWFSMEHLPGKNLEQLVREHPLAAEDAADLVRRVAEAVQHAHDHGVLHRDLKPSNILLDRNGMPRVTDFGIARIDGRGVEELTATGQVLGSPGYAAPEQAFGGEANARTDVYGLGALLYHLLTGRPPFQAPTLDAILMQLRDSEPLSPRQLNPTVARDLETICLKCLRKDSPQRYPWAKAVADDLARFLSGEPIRARPPTPAERAWRWGKRRPWTAVLVAACGILLTTLVFGSLAVARREHREERRVTLLAMSREARAERLGGSRARALAAITEAWQLKPSAELREEAIAALAMPGIRFLPKIGGEFPVPAALTVMDSSGKRRATVRSQPEANADFIEIQALADGAVLHRLEFPHRITCLDWSGELLVAGGREIRLLHVWDTITGQRLHRFSGHNADLEAVSFRPGGQEFVSIARDGMLRLWHAGLGEEIARLSGLPEHAGPVAWSEGGRVLKVRRSDGSAVDGFRFAWPLSVTIVGPGAAEPRSENLPTLHLDADGRHAVTVDETACRLWSLSEGRELARFPKTGTEWISAAFTPDALWLAGWNAGLRKIPLTPGDLKPSTPALSPGPLLVASSRDGSHLALTQNEQRPADDRMLLVSTSDLSTRNLPQMDPFCAAFSPDGKQLVTGSFRAAGATLHTLETGEHRTLDHTGLVLGARFSDDGRQLWLWGDHAVTRWDTATWKSQTIHAGQAPLALAISPDGHLAASATRRFVILHDARDLSQITRLEIPAAAGEAGMPTIAFSPDGSHLAIHVEDGGVISWDLPVLQAELARWGMEWKGPHAPDR